MNSYDQIYLQVREMNRQWQSRVAEIRAGTPSSPAEHIVVITEEPGGAVLGRVVVGGQGEVYSIDLYAHEVQDMHCERVVAALLPTINEALERAFRSRMSVGVR
ncbi:hypothetical protein [Nocardia brasiliensis]|uniref:hypothetical protein n=1 Tax=Nocardia brasiliensis TaxID=37326 RepID=UPI00366E7284